MESTNSSSGVGFVYASLILSIVLTLFTGFFIVSSKSYRSVIGYSAFLAALVSLISNILLLSSFSIVYMDTFLSGLYSSFTHLTILYAFNRLSKNDVNKASQYIVYFGYFWILVTIVTGLVLTIMLEKAVTGYYYYFPVQDVLNLSRFFLYSSWAFVVIIWALFGMLYRKLSKKSSGSMIAFAVLLTIESVCTLIFSFAYLDGVSGLVILFIFIKLPIVAAIMIAINYGPYWIKDSEIDANTEPCNNDLESSGPVEHN